MDIKKILTPVGGWDIDAIVILTANLMALFGVVFYGWSLFCVLFLFWSEAAIMGFFNVLKMIMSPTVSEKIKNGNDRLLLRPIILKSFAKAIYIPFFIVHYSMFLAGNLFFIYFVSYAPYIVERTGRLPPVAHIPSVAFLAFLMLVLSHGYSFIKNFLGKKEYLQISTESLMVALYQRIILANVTLLIGGAISIAAIILLQQFGANDLAIDVLSSSIILFFIVLKIYADILSHSKEHSKFKNLGGNFSLKLRT